MKSIFSGIALAAALAVTMPAFTVPALADAPGGGYRSKAAKMGMSKAHPRGAAHARAGRMHKNSAAMLRGRPMQRTMAPRAGWSPTDNVADQLNRAEVERLSGSSMPPGGAGMHPGGAGMHPMGYPPPQPMYQGR